ncbi:2Fe-2S iron-sulfur cluster-binding protein [Dickeya solani]|uniref:2Fe-2S iron-sulfur cluster-binding protein n=2 Tax=Dickeya solani TaxID=1089444 RepID=A0AAP8Q7V9_9GAMM|nr:2Fe-2S iron-sulfur cluster-binding protein [Dickeya solani]ANE76153.1 ferredoxin [Dickeya solani IPO 2222]AUH08438.1 ferredoxin [Dickeya solani D s0432-1]AUH12436.1 ferredoxin [Dickeya solani]AYQ46611.1 Ferredoxin-1 [Dickeya solani]AYQ50782.1 Ferredoxin-1 [Dickeya solani]
MPIYHINIMSCGKTKTIKCSDDQYILDAAEEEGLELPYSCRAGACSSCACRALTGKYDDSDQSFLDEDQQGKYLLPCVTYPQSDMFIMSHAEEDLTS